jgi:hypothetical protein
MRADFADPTMEAHRKFDTNEPITIGRKDDEDLAQPRGRSIGWDVLQREHGHD